ncbi:MAG: TonB family protein, partial [Chitinivibrionales bacterium]|nr:TonB family protein [Chitinivibrionales bacterium]
TQSPTETADEQATPTQKKKIAKKVAQKRVAKRAAKVEQKIRTVGVLGMLTGVGKTAKGPKIANVLGKNRNRKENIQDLDAILNKSTGLQKASNLDVLNKKLVKSKDLTVNHKEDIGDLVAGIGQAATTSLAKKGDFVIQRPESIEGAASSNAKRDDKAINKIVRMHKRSIRMAYERYLRSDPSLSGKITVRFTIATSGRVVRVEILENTTGSASLENDIRQRIRRWKFDELGTGDGDVTVTYPFVFSQSK